MMRPNFPYLLFLLLIVFSIINTRVFSQEVTKLAELKIADNGLYFDGEKRTGSDLNTDGPGHDFYFGRRITPHGDCIKVFGDYVFMSWYAGGEDNRHVMLSRYNMKTEVLETIEFPHSHIGFRLKYPHIGDSHNTIAVAISPLDSTVHLLYDMHSYNQQEFPDDFFNYNISENGVALVADGEFTLDKFNPKQTYLNQIYNYSDITYPNFFLNNRGELFVWFREGGNNNGAYKFAKYNGQLWSNFTDFNILNAKGRGVINYNWGLYGDLKYVAGKLRVGFVKRMNINNDPYVYNNGWHYAYTNDPNGKTKWYNYKGQPLSLPIVDPADLFFYEPASQVQSNGANSITISSGADWTVTDTESIHFITNNIRSTTGENVDVHGFKKASDVEFAISTDFPGGNLYSVRGDLVFLSGLDSGKPYIYVAKGGTNDWELLYEATDGPNFRHASILVEDDKLFMYLMENSSGDAQPIHLQVYDLGLPEIENPLGYEDDAMDRMVFLFPNPAGNQLFIDHSTQSPIEYIIYNLEGARKLTGKTDNKTIDIRSLRRGLYLLQMGNDEFTVQMKFLVK